jgi:shikimate kinase
MDRPIVIAGFMGSGKTTVAKAVAQLLDCVAVDLDEFIEHNEHRSAKVIINEDGEERFREIETHHLRNLLGLGPRQVIALGGGAWIPERNRELIRAQGSLTVWLDAPFELCWQRIAASAGERPLAPSMQQAQLLYEQRRSIYELASLHVVADGKTDLLELATQVVEAAR